MTTPFYDPKIFLLEHDLEKEFMQQTLELIAFIQGRSESSDERSIILRQMYMDAICKYKDYDSMSMEAVKEVIIECGYSYLLDIFELTEKRIKILAAYLPLIQELKGSRPGLELVFSILGVGFQIKEWWEDPVNLEVLSYVLFVEIVNQPVSTQIVPRIKEFSRSYVYPLLTNVLYAVRYELNPTPYIGGAVHYKNVIEIWQEVLWLVWSEDSQEFELWSDEKPYQDPIEHESVWQATDDSILTWNDLGDYTPEESKWSDENNRRIWNVNYPTDKDLLYWWINRIGTVGPINENWSAEDEESAAEAFTYWS